jgi:Eukaryotic DNA topoisomerase I, catalytic core
VLAAVVSLLESTHIRVGNPEYLRQNNSRGLTTLYNRHVEVSGSRLRFRFRGKSGRIREVEMSHARLARIVRRCQEIPGQELFQYLDDEGTPRSVASGDVNRYLREISGLHGQGLPHLGRDGAGQRFVETAQGRTLYDGSQTKRGTRDRRGRRATRKHTGNLPQVLHSPRRDRQLSREVRACACGIERNEADL